MNQIDNIKKSDLDLGGLIIPKFDPEEIRKTSERIDAEQEEYKKKYGDDWFKKWWADKNPKPDYDVFLKNVNKSIYYGTPLMIGGIGPEVQIRRKRMYDRMREIYGDKYDTLMAHAPGEPWISDLLLQDAIKTGKWKELPDELQSEYHRRVNA